MLSLARNKSSVCILWTVCNKKLRQESFYCWNSWKWISVIWLFWDELEFPLWTNEIVWNWKIRSVFNHVFSRHHLIGSSWDSILLALSNLFETPWKMDRQTVIGKKWVIDFWMDSKSAVKYKALKILTMQKHFVHNCHRNIVVESPSQAGIQ